MDLSSYLAVIRERPGLPVTGAVELRQGQFHDVVLTATAAYRFPRDEASLALLPRRAAILVALAGHAFWFAVPEPLAPVDGAEPLGRCFLATTRVPGRPLSRGDADRSPGAVGSALGRVLAALSEATTRVGPLVDAVADQRAWTRFAAGVEEVLFPLMSRAGRRRAQRELDRVRGLPAPEHPVLVHGDLGGNNLLWEPGEPPRLAGVLDWDGLFLGNPANDVASIAATYGWSVAIRAARDIDRGDEMLDQARHIRATFALQQALPAARSGDTASLEDALRTYRGGSSA